MSAVLYALLNNPVSFPKRGGSYTCYPLIEARALALTFGATNPPAPPPPLNIRDLEPRPPAPEPLAPDPEPAKGKGGRPRKHDWEAFYIEVAWWAAANDLSTDGNERPELQRYMVEWCQRWGNSAPDPRTIQDKLRDLYIAGKLRS